jgi:hypothetical protein
VKTQDGILFLVFGAVFWIAGTIWYGRRGAQVFETTSQRYWVNFVLTPIISTAICVLLLRWRHVPERSWAAATLLIAIPGMIGEAILLGHFAEFMPRMQPVSAGKYGSFLFATYAVVLAVAEGVALSARG